jgi:hypothetical protein
VKARRFPPPWTVHERSFFIKVSQSTLIPDPN